jgi:Ternary complex associated domain 9
MSRKKRRINRMQESHIWWDDSDSLTSELISRLGGRDVVREAIQDVLPGRKIKLRTLTPGISGAVVFHAAPERSHDGHRVVEVDAVLKVGSAKLLADEVKRYHDWVSPVLEEASQFALLEAPHDLAKTVTESPDAICALHYRHVGSTTLGEQLKTHVRTNDLVTACATIDKLLSILRPWQESMEPSAEDSLTAPGVYAFSVDPFDEFESFCAHLNASIRTTNDHIPEQYRHVRALWAPRALLPERMLKSVLHGDLHTDNVMVGRDGQLTLIDFGACGQGHILRDITTFEAHVSLRALAPAGNEIGAEHRDYLS